MQIQKEQLEEMNDFELASILLQLRPGYDSSDIIEQDGDTAISRSAYNNECLRCLNINTESIIVDASRRHGESTREATIKIIKLLRVEAEIARIAAEKSTGPESAAIKRESGLKVFAIQTGINILTGAVTLCALLYFLGS